MNKLMYVFLLSFTLNASATNKDLIKNKSDQYSSNKDLQEMVLKAENKNTSRDSIARVEKIITSQEFKKKVSTHTTSIMDILNLEKPKVSDSEKIEALSDMGDRVVLYVSASIPIDVLRTYAKDLANINGVMVISGHISNSKGMKDTIDFIRKLIVVDTNCDTINCEVINLNFAIDPERFTINKIKSVPAMTYERKMDMSAYCKALDKKEADLVIYGDASLKGMLLTYNHNKNDKNILALLNVL